jgi:hypothetical protein
MKSWSNRLRRRLPHIRWTASSYQQEQGKITSALCGKYFPNGDFITAKNKRNSTGRNALQCGLVRRIGDWESTNICQDRWIPGAIGGRPICPKRKPRRFELVNSPIRRWMQLGWRSIGSKPNAHGCTGSVMNSLGPTTRRFLGLVGVSAMACTLCVLPIGYMWNKKPTRAITVKAGPHTR